MKNWGFIHRQEVGFEVSIMTQIIDIEKVNLKESEQNTRNTNRGKGSHSNSQIRNQTKAGVTHADTSRNDLNKNQGKTMTSGNEKTHKIDFRKKLISN